MTDEEPTPIRKVMWDIETNDTSFMQNLIDEEMEVHDREQKDKQAKLLTRMGDEAVREIYTWTQKKDLANGEL